MNQFLSLAKNERMFVIHYPSEAFFNENSDFDLKTILIAIPNFFDRRIDAVSYRSDYPSDKNILSIKTGFLEVASLTAWRGKRSSATPRLSPIKKQK